MKVQINFWNGKTALEYEAENIAKALEMAVKDGADLTRANLYGADLTRANLTRANLYGADLTRANLTRADLYGADLTRANLYGANLYGADLTRANLTRANLTGADLTRTDLTRANLTRANLTGADLTRANLTGADLTGADLTRANLTGADLEVNGKKLWATRPILQLGPCGGVNRTTIVYLFDDKSDPEIRCGCFTGDLAQFRAKIKETHGGAFHEREYNAMADHIEAIYKIQQSEVNAE